MNKNSPLEQVRNKNNIYFEKGSILILYLHNIIHWWLLIWPFVLNFCRKRLNSTESCHHRASTPLLGVKTVGHHHFISSLLCFNTDSLIILSLKNLFSSTILHLLTTSFHNSSWSEINSHFKIYICLYFLEIQKIYKYLKYSVPPSNLSPYLSVKYKA